MVSLGAQILGDLYGCDRQTLDDVAAIEAVLMEAALRCGATIVSRCFHRFVPQGVSGVVVIAESHLAIHTWPEHGYAAVDLFTCGKTLRPDDCFRYLQEALRSDSHRIRTVERGIPSSPPNSSDSLPFPSVQGESKT
jgi:S-adenosylmethionine decarboxylase